ncbi:hypothetical protein [Sinosporangium siamense]|uniref:Uncharacterized protein n=1 Tax=Sinosporangium siamense TaxID=1367973 RepID=A0A919RFY3_9ACTN|nr:hypothetical protein [Sinosporangium siamense]GII91196.1 hypothetical protein Ssi02_14270 [Sinosporangium siamense]
MNAGPRTPWTTRRAVTTGLAVVALAAGIFALSHLTQADAASAGPWVCRLNLG